MIKNYLSSSYCVLFLVLFLSHSQAQTTLPLPIIEYKWADGQLSGIMPFDQAFSIKITGMPSTIETIDLTLYEIRKNYPLFTKEKGGVINVITHDEFVRMPWMRTYKMANWKRQPGNADTFAFIPENYPLYPNSQYVIEIQASSITALSTTAQDDLKDQIEGSAKIRALFNDLGQTFGVKGKPLHNLNPFIADLNRAIQTELSILDATYIFKAPPDELTQLQEAAGYTATIRTLQKKVNDLMNSGDTANAQIKTDIAAAATLSKTIDEIDFGDFVFDPDSRTPFTTDLASIQKTGNASYDNKIDAINKIAATISEQADNILETVITDIVLRNTYIFTAIGANYPVAMSDQANNYLGLDFGLAYVGNFSRIQSYYGLNIYLRPINKNIPLGRYVGWKDRFLTRTSLLLGVTFSSVEKDNIRKGVLGDKGLMLGAGFRVLSFFRIQAGGLAYYRYPTDPLANKENYSLRVSPFFSASFDLSVQDLLGVFGSSFFPPKTTTTTTTP